MAACAREAHRAEAALRRFHAYHDSQRSVATWHEDMYHHFAGELKFAHLRLVDLGHDWLHLPVIAFAARNLLELSIWIRFCGQSAAHSRRFYEDKFKDGLGFYNALTRWVGCVPNQDLASMAIDAQKKVLKGLASSVGADVSDDDYTKVARAADELGGREYFTSLNTMLSKVAHPASTMVLNYATAEYRQSINDLAIFF